MFINQDHFLEEKKMKIKNLFLLTILSSTCLLFSQTYEVKVGTPDLTNFPKIDISFDVLDSNQNKIQNITTKNIDVFEDSILNQSVELNRFKESNKNISLLLAVDGSRSMRTSIDTVRSAIRFFINQIGEDDRISILTFGKSIKTITPFSSEKTLHLDNIDSIKADDLTTELYYGVFSGLKFLEEETSENKKILVVLSDGKDEGTAYSDDDCIEFANSLNIPIYTIGFKGTAEEKYLRILERMSDKTNGIYNLTPSPLEINNTFNNLFDQIQERTILSFNSKIFKPDSSTHTINIKTTIDDVELNSSIQITTPKKDKNFLSNNNLFFLIFFILVLIIFYFIFYFRNKKKKEIEEKLNVEKERLRLEKEKLEKDKLKEKKLSNLNENKKIDPRVTSIGFENDFSNQNKIKGNLLISFKNGPLEGETKEFIESFTIGRKPNNDIIIQNNTVSGNHCKFSKNEHWEIIDLNSTNGTIVNGSKVKSKTLSSFDKISIGSVDMKINEKES